MAKRYLRLAHILVGSKVVHKLITRCNDCPQCVNERNDDGHKFKMCFLTEGTLYPNNNKGDIPIPDVIRRCPLERFEIIEHS